jgi:hypothetical protein
MDIGRGGADGFSRNAHLAVLDSTGYSGGNRGDAIADASHAAAAKARGLPRSYTVVRLAAGETFSAHEPGTAQLTTLADITDTAPTPSDAVRRQPATPGTDQDQDQLTNRCTSGHNLPGVGSER